MFSTREKNGVLKTEGRAIYIWKQPASSAKHAWSIFNIIEWGPTYME
jgi:hypothetical protein